MFGSEFPEAKLHLCLFHILQSFCQEVICDKFGITSGERDEVLDNKSKMTYAKSGVEYEKI